MTMTTGLFAALTLSAMLTVSRSDAEYQLPPPTNLSYVWINKFAVKISWDWERPGIESLAEKSKISYELVVEQPYPKKIELLDSKSHVEHCITENGDSDHCKFTVHAKFHEETCNGCNHSTDVTETARREEPRVELVKDFKCLYTTEGFNCSWIPVDPYLNLELSYRACASDPNNNESLKPCNRPYSTGERKGCYWSWPSLGRAQVLDDPDICIYIESEIGWHYFKPIIGPASPVLTITEDHNHLKLTWSSPEIQNNCIWIYELCYRECDKSEQCRNHTHELSDQNETLSPQNEMLYNRDCRYEFRSRLKTSGNCPKLVSDWSEIVTHGANKTPDQTLPLVAIIIPIILFVCILLACYCFRRHSDIICPNIPDPSAIFKEMVNGNREHNKAEQKPFENVYTPMPEDVESCKVTLINQSGALQPNS
ncbi:interleukin-13 receptor subunit alpha-1-like [Platichthys flesus]|uniref:interleukin-13 receptor subunit alpha-1-like n=1 Tax=Platichthys flesus TaxID=8260 RepID=UPI002DB58BD0|nr:interleukin-13 receptor subunit alpha-1-like [Platichthys flesus]